MRLRQRDVILQSQRLDRRNPFRILSIEACPGQVKVASASGLEETSDHRNKIVCLHIGNQELLNDFSFLLPTTEGEFPVLM